MAVKVWGRYWEEMRRFHHWPLLIAMLVAFWKGKCFCYFRKCVDESFEQSKHRLWYSAVVLHTAVTLRSLVSSEVYWKFSALFSLENWITMRNLARNVWPKWTRSTLCMLSKKGRYEERRTLKSSIRFFGLLLEWKKRKKEEIWDDSGGTLTESCEPELCKAAASQFIVTSMLSLWTKDWWKLVWDDCLFRPHGDRMTTTGHRQQPLDFHRPTTPF